MANSTAPQLQDLIPAVESAAALSLFGTIERKAIEKFLSYVNAPGAAQNADTPGSWMSTTS